MWKHMQYSSDYLSEILKMTREEYGPENDISNLDFLEHQYFENPAGDAVIDLAVDTQSGALAGQYLVCPMRFRVGGETVACVNSLNTLTGKAYRGQGIFVGLAESTYQRGMEMGYKFCYGAPNPNSYPGFMKKLSFVDLGRVPLMLRPLHPSQMVREFLHSRGLGILAKPADPFFRVKVSAGGNAVEIQKVTHENLALMDHFWENVNGKYPVMNIRDSVFVRFRYLDMPRRSYFPYVAIQDSRPVCFAVGRIMEVAGMQCAMLADFLFEAGREPAAETLLRKLLGDMQERGAGIAGCLMLEHTSESHVLKKLGFFKCPKKLEPQPFPLILRLFDKTMKETEILQLRNWFFAMGDYDVI